MSLNTLFQKFSLRISKAVGSPPAFIVAGCAILVWALTGPIFNYSDTWQLIINTSTTIVTFLMVFLIQNTQNRDSKALQLKLDELLYHMHGARNQLIDLEDATEEEIEMFSVEFKKRREQECDSPVTVVAVAEKTHIKNDKATKTGVESSKKSAKKATSTAKKKSTKK